MNSSLTTHGTLPAPLMKDWPLLLPFRGSKGSWTKWCRCMEMLRHRDTSSTQYSPTYLFSHTTKTTWLHGRSPCLYSHTAVHLSLEMRFACMLQSQKRYFNTPTHLLRKQNWAEIFLWHLFSPFFSMEANEEFHVHIIVTHSNLISLRSVRGLNTQRKYIGSHKN